MMAAISAAAARASESLVGRWYGIIGDGLDRALPIAIAIAVAIGTILVVFNLVS